MRTLWLTNDLPPRGGGIEQFVGNLLDRTDPDEALVVVWQTGRRYFDALRAEVPDHPRLRLLQYLDRMDYAYAVTLVEYLAGLLSGTAADP